MFGDLEDSWDPINNPPLKRHYVTKNERKQLRGKGNKRKPTQAGRDRGERETRAWGGPPDI